MLILILCFLFLVFFGEAYSKENKSKNSIKILFTGDILLSRLVEEEFKKNPDVNPWSKIKTLFGDASLLIGNLEGAVGQKEQCQQKIPPNLCFSVLPTRIKLLKKVGFTAISIENNHAADLGQTGREATLKILLENNIIPLEYKNSPNFIKAKSLTIGIINFSMISDADGNKIEIPSFTLKQKLRLAQKLSDLVIVYAHWGKELQDWTSPPMSNAARWLIENGADIIVGSHPHVIIKPECIINKPVFFSLGNHLFDQKYPVAKEGLLVECTIYEDSRIVKCSTIRIKNKEGVLFPTTEIKKPIVSQEDSISDCNINLHRPIKINDVIIRGKQNLLENNDEIILEGWREGKILWQSVPSKLISISGGRLNEANSKELLFTVEKYFSSIDKEIAPRPYVYRVTDKGLISLWRGSSLAWPLLDAVIMCDKKCAVCAFHRGDSFLMLDPKITKTRTALYRWNGFGFSEGIFPGEFIKNCKQFF